MQTRLPLWQAALFVLLGGVAAQLGGGLVAGMMRAWLAGHGHAMHPGSMPAVVIVPAMLASACCLIAVACFAPALAGMSLRRALSLRPAPPLCFAAAALGTVMLGPTADGLMRGMQALLPKLNLGVVAMLHDLVRGIPALLAWPVFALMPGISEELMFRGLLQTAASRAGETRYSVSEANLAAGWDPDGFAGRAGRARALPGEQTSRTRFAIAISGLSFALFHLDPHHIAGVLPLGFFLAWVASRCGTLVTMFAHVANNTAAIAAVHSSTFDVGYGTEAEMPWSWIPASLFLVALCAWAIVRSTRSVDLSPLPYSDPVDL